MACRRSLLGVGGDSSEKGKASGISGAGLVGQNWARTIGEEKSLAKKFTVIGPNPASNPREPPALGEAGRRLWAAIHADYIIDDAGGLALLAQICAAADRVAEFAVAIARDGPVVRTKAGTIKDHPLLRHELAAQSFIVRSLHRAATSMWSCREARSADRTETTDEHDPQAQANDEVKSRPLQTN